MKAQSVPDGEVFMPADDVRDALTEKVNEYRVMSAPLEQAMRELEYAQSLLKARAESDISQTVPALGALSDILDISPLDLLMAPDRLQFVHAAMARQGLTGDDVARQMRSLSAPGPDGTTPPPADLRDGLQALGLNDPIG